MGALDELIDLIENDAFDGNELQPKKEKKEKPIEYKTIATICNEYFGGKIKCQSFNCKKKDDKPLATCILGSAGSVNALWLCQECHDRAVGINCYVPGCNEVVAGKMLLGDNERMLCKGHIEMLANDADLVNLMSKYEMF